MRTRKALVLSMFRKTRRVCQPDRSKLEGREIPLDVAEGHLEILTIDGIRLAVALDRPRDEANVLHLELRESNSEALGKTMDGVRLLFLDPGDEARNRELAHVSRHVESHPHLVARRS